MRLICIRALATLEIVDVRPIVPLEPHRFRIPLERQNVRRNMIEKPSIMRDHHLRIGARLFARAGVVGIAATLLASATSVGLGVVNPLEARWTRRQYG